jgi:hypothetical protein
VDLAWPEQKVAVEYDGAWHDSPGQFGQSAWCLPVTIEMIVIDPSNCRIETY